MKHAAIWAVALALSGCASGLDGFDQKVQFASAPTGASANVVLAEVPDAYGNNTPFNVGSCTTPCSLVIRRDRTYQATFTKEGCTSTSARLYPTRDSTFFTPLLPDSVTGKTYDLKPDPVSVTMSCGGAA